MSLKKDITLSKLIKITNTKSFNTALSNFDFNPNF